MIIVILRGFKCFSIILLTCVFVVSLFSFIIVSLWYVFIVLLSYFFIVQLLCFIILWVLLSNTRCFTHTLCAAFVGLNIFYSSQDMIKGQAEQKAMLALCHCSPMNNKIKKHTSPGSCNYSFPLFSPRITIVSHCSYLLFSQL